MNPEIDRMEWLAEGVGRYWHYALGGLAIICLMSGNYAPLMEHATQRYLESQGNALWQLQERADAARGALWQVVAEVEQAVREAAERRRLREEAARRALEEQQRAEAERLRLAQSKSEYEQAYAQSRAEFDGIVRRYYSGLVMTLAEVVKFETALSNEVRKPGFLDGKPFTMGEISTPVACGNPASFDKLFNLDGTRDRNLRACMLYYASNDRHAQSKPLHRHAVTALFMRLKWPEDEHHTLPRTFALLWYMAIVNAANLGNYAPSPSSLFSGDELSNSIFTGVDSGFTALVTQKATNREILLLRDTVHPDMQRLASLADQMVIACRALRFSPCIPSVISF